MYWELNCDKIFIRVEEINSRNKVYMFGMEVPYGEELISASSFLKFLYRIEYNFEEGELYKFTIINTLKTFEVRDCFSIYAKYKGLDDDEEMVWDIIVDKDHGYDF